MTNLTTTNTEDVLVDQNGDILTITGDFVGDSTGSAFFRLRIRFIGVILGLLLCQPLRPFW
jgi:hypothetical protein